MSRSSVLVDVSVEGCDVEVYVNDVPLFRVTTAHESGVFPANHLIVRGDNVFEVLVNPGSHPSVARTEKRSLPGEGVSVRVHVALCPPGTSPGDAGTTTLLRFGDVAPDGPTEFPRAARAALAMEPEYGPWAWERADVLTLDGALLQEATKYVQSLHASLARKSFPAFFAHNEVAHVEVASAFDVSAAERRASGEAALNETFADPAFGMAPLVAEQFDYRLVANGRLIDCVAKDWDALVRTLPDGEGHVMRFPIMLGRVDGSLRGLR